MSYRSTLRRTQCESLHHIPCTRSAASLHGRTADHCHSYNEYTSLPDPRYPVISFAHVASNTCKWEYIGPPYKHLGFETRREHWTADLQTTVTQNKFLFHSKSIFYSAGILYIIFLLLLLCAQYADLRGICRAGGAPTPFRRSL